MDKWEYKIEQYNFLENGWWVAFLNQLGQEGWELIQKDKSDKEPNLTTCIFKRKIQQEDVSNSKTNQKTFKCKDEVVYQHKISFGENEPCIWNYGIVSYEDEEYVHLVGNVYVCKRVHNVLPYKGNEHLVGTSNELQ